MGRNILRRDIMFFKKLETEGLAHYSYIVGSNGESIIVDPMRDSNVYLDVFKEEGLKLKYIFETHRNEDYISGSKELSESTGAKVLISGHEDLGYEYGEKIYDGDEVEFGELIIKGLHTPGHTKGHMAYVLIEKEKDNPYMVFTGDCLFMGDVGRTDFYGKENLEEMTGLIYDSIFNKILKLGDGVIVNPAHGNGSACGDSMDERPITTAGYERLNNLKLKYTNKDDFIKNHGKMKIKPRYFEKMEICNTKGADFVNCDGELKPLKFSEINSEHTLVDLRSPQAFAESHIPGSYFLSPGNLASFLGTILDTESNLVFIAQDDNLDIIERTYWTARRMGFDNIAGYLKGGVQGFINSAKDWDRIKTIRATDYCNLEDKITLDIRGVDNLEEIGKSSEDYYKIPLKVLYKDFDILPKDKSIYILCNSGNTATTAASFLVQRGYDVVVIAGGYQAVKRLG